MSRAQLALTPEAVAAVLADAGFQAAEMDDYWHRPVTDGFQACSLPVTHEDRVAVMWHRDLYDRDVDYVHVPGPDLDACAAALEAAGYQVEFVADQPAGYLAVWVEGEF